MAKLIREDNNYAFRVDQIAWISLKKGDPGSINEIEQKPRVSITLIGNHASNVITLNSFEDAQKYYNEIVNEMSKI